jgi:hypothetical protein
MDELVVLGMETLFLIFSLILGYGFVRRFHLRKHVWLELRMRVGDKKLHQVRPEEDGSLETKWGRYVPSPNVPFEMFNGGWFNGGKKQIFTFYQGDPRPIRYTQTWVFMKPSHTEIEGAVPTATNGGTQDAPDLRQVSGTPQLVKVSVAGHQTIPAETLSTFMKNKLYSDVYGSKNWLQLLIIGGILLLFLMVAALLFKGG